MMNDNLSVENLSVEYGSAANPMKALSDVSFTLPANSSCCFLGSSGAGKTTLGLALIGLLNQVARIRGSIVLPGGVSPNQDAEEIRNYRRRCVSVIFQDAFGSILPATTLGRQAETIFALRHGIDRRTARELARAALAEVGLVDVDRIWNARSSALSGGMAQRFCVCVSVLAAPSPRILICDEPTSSLDSVLAAQILTLLFRVKQDHKLAMLLIAHDVRLASQCDFTAVLSEGRLVEFRKSRDFLAAPQSDAGRRLVEASLLLGGIAPPVPISHQE